VRLVYEISADDRQFRRILRGVEQEAKASNRRVGRDAQTSSAATARRASTSAANREELAAAKALERARISAARNELRERERGERELNRAQMSLDRQRSAALASQFKQQEREQLRAQAVRERTIHNIRGGVARTLGGSVGHVAGLVGAGAAIAGGIGIAGALDSRLAISRKASMLANQSEEPGAKGAIAAEAQNVRGFTGEESLDFLTNFHEKSGDLGAARGALKDMAELALATGTNFDELGSAAGSAFTVVRDQVKDPQERLRVLKEVMTAVAQQGSMGAIEMRNLVDGMSELGGATRSFQGGPARILKSMGGLAQMALQRGGAGSPEEAVTAVARFATDIPEHAKEFQKQGIGIYTDASHTQLRAPEQILADMLTKTGGDLGKMGDLFGVRSQKVARGLSPLYTQAERENAALPASQRAAKGTAGKKAILAEFEKFAGATRSNEELAAQAGSRLEDPDLQIKEATKQFNAAVGEQLAPVAVEAAQNFSKFTPQVAEGTRALSMFVAFVASNPLAGIGSIVGAAIAKDIAGAGLSNIISGEVSGKLGALLSGGGLGITVATMIVTANVMNFAKREEQMKQGGAAVLQAQALAKTGDVDAITKLLDQQTAIANDTKDPGVLASVLSTVIKGAMYAGPVGWAAAGVAKLAGTDSTKLGGQLADAATDQNRTVAAKSMEGFVDAIEKARDAAIKMQSEMAKVKAPDQRDPRGGPIKPG
jgi:hypothetical protein